MLNFLVYGQHEADFWYFGNYAGLDFSSGKPEPLTNGQLQNYEGCAVASDSTGNLLFYTNGMTVWNKNHQIMQNGEDLMGHNSSTQSSIVIPYPDKDSLYYIFTVDVFFVDTIPDYQHKGLRYSIVNMNKNNNLGEVETKNNLLLDTITEKITAVYHQNGKDIWIISHDWGNNNFLVWLIDNNGIQPIPIISSVGSIHSGLDPYFVSSIGYLKVSSSGDRIVLAILGKTLYEIFDFDNLTGIVSNPITLTFPISSYGCEFSADASKLYMSDNFKLMQADMNAGTSIDIINSVTEIADFSNPVGALQLAKDGKLYIATDESDYLSVINYPDSLLVSCGFEKNAIYLEGKKSRIGLPNFIQSYFKKPDFKYQKTCVFDETQFLIQDLSEIDSVEWNFGEPESGSLNFSKEFSPFHKYSISGTFKVILKVWFNNNATDYVENIKIVALPDIDLGNDTTFCISDNYIIDAYSNHATYLWDDLSVLSSLNVDTTGKYWVDIENIYTGCKNSDTINIIFSDIPEVNLGTDTSFCEQTSFLLDAYHENYTYLWQDLSEESNFTAFQAGTYFVKVANEDDCFNIDTIELTHKLIPRFNLPEDTTLCENTVLFLSPNLENDVSFSWQDGSTDNSFLVSDSGFYKLITQNICGSWADSLNVNYRYCGDIYIPNIITPTNDGINELFYIKGIEEGIWNLNIYNRWGQLVNRFSDYKNTWDGKDFSGRELAETVYYYVLTNPDTAEVYKGTIRVFR